MKTTSAFLKDLVSTTKDGDWGRTEPAEGHTAYSVIRGTDFDAVGLGDYHNVPVRFLADKTVERRRLQENDILIETAGGSPTRPTGRTLLITQKILATFDLPVTCASFARFIRVDSSKVDPRYIYWFLRNLYNSGRMEIWQVQHTGVARFQYTQFAAAQPIPLPDREHQKNISDFLGKIDQKIEANNSLESIASELLSAKFSSMKIDADLPSSETVPLKEYFDLNPRYQAPAEEYPVYLDMQKLPISRMLISNWGHRAGRGGARFKNGDTLIARITPCLENGKTGFVDFLDDGQIAIGSTEYIVIRSNPGIPLSLSYFVATSERFRRYAIRHMVGTSGRQRLSAADLANYQLGTVSRRHLEEWQAMASPIVDRLGVARDETATLAALRDVLLPQLIRGEISVRGASRDTTK